MYPKRSRSGLFRGWRVRFPIDSHLLPFPDPTHTLAAILKPSHGDTNAPFRSCSIRLDWAPGQSMMARGSWNSRLAVSTVVGVTLLLWTLGWVFLLPSFFDEHPLGMIAATAPLIGSLVGWSVWVSKKLEDLDSSLSTEEERKRDDRATRWMVTVWIGATMVAIALLPIFVGEGSFFLVRRTVISIGLPGLAVALVGTVFLLGEVVKASDAK